MAIKLFFTPSRRRFLLLSPTHTGVSTARAAGGGKGRRGPLRRERQRPGVFEGTSRTRTQGLGPRQAKGFSQEGEGRMSADRSYRHSGRAWVTGTMQAPSAVILLCLVGRCQEQVGVRFQQSKAYLSSLASCCISFYAFGIRVLGFRA